MYYCRPKWLPIYSHITHLTADMGSMPQRDPAYDFSTVSNRQLVLDICEAQRTTSTITPKLTAMVTELCVRAYEKLMPYFPHPPAFMDALGFANAGITGSWLLAFILDAQDWFIKDLDIVAAKGAPAQIVEQALRVAGYVQINQFDSLAHLYTDSSMRFLEQVTTWYNHQLKTRVDVMHSLTDHAIDPVRGFHSTSVMNVFTPTHILIMFPDLTFGYDTYAHHDVPAKIVEKYERRGFTFHVSNSSLTEPCGTSCPSLIRNVATPKSCLTVPIDHRYALLPPSFIPPYKCWTAPFQCRNRYCSRNLLCKMGGRE